MSGLSTAKRKIKEGADWRGTINVQMGDEQVSLTVRQLRDPELEEVLEKIDRSALDELSDAYPDDVREELSELRQQDELDDEEAERLEELEAEMEAVDVDVFDVLPTETFEGIRLAAVYGVEPDMEDMRDALKNRAHEFESEYGIKVSEPEDTREPLKHEWEQTIYNATNFQSFEIGMRVLEATVDDEGNSES